MGFVDKSPEPVEDFFEPPKIVRNLENHKTPPERNGQETILAHGFKETLVAEGLIQPTAMEFVPDGRLFVAQKNGLFVKVVVMMSDL